MDQAALVIIGAGDHARVVVDLARACGRFITGFLGPEPEGTPLATAGLVRLGDLDHPDWLAALGEAEFTVAIGNNAARAHAFSAALKLGLVPATLVHPTAVVLGGARIELGSQICAAAVIGVEAQVLADSIVNTGASIDHHDRIGPHAFVGPGARLAGRVIVEDGAHVGIGAVVREGSIIGRDSYVAAGAVVIGPVGAGVRVAGVPARPMDDH